MLARAAAFSNPNPPAFPRFTSALQPQQLDYLQEQMRAGKLEPGWPIYREADGLYIYLEGELSLSCLWGVHDLESGLWAAHLPGG